MHIPAKSLRDRDTVWIASQGEIQVRTVKIAHVDFDDVYLSGGIRIGEKIITSPVKGAANGMKVQLAGMKKKDGKRRAKKQNSADSNLSRESL